MCGAGVEFDLVCGKPVQLGRQTLVVTFGPHRFFFCSAACRDRFAEFPVLYLRRAWSRRDGDRSAPEQFVPEGGPKRC